MKNQSATCVTPLLFNIHNAKVRHKSHFENIFMTPNSTELEILKLLWKKQPLTAKEIHQHLESKYWWSYSSTRKTLERMGNKGILEIGAQGNKKTFKALLEKIPTLAACMQEFATNVLEIDEPLPVDMFADSRLIDKAEIDELEKLLSQLSEGKKPKE